MCKVAINGGYCRGSNRFNHLLQRGGRLGARGVFYARVCYARGQALFAAPKYSYRKRWCVATTTLRSVKYARGYLPSVESISFCASGVLAGVAIRSSGKGCPFGIPSTARRVFAANAVRWWRRSHWRKIQPDQYGEELRRRGVSRGPIACRLEGHRLSPRGRGGGECRPPLCHLGGFGLGSLSPRRSVAGIGPRGVDGGRRSRPTRAF